MFLSESLLPVLLLVSFISSIIVIYLNRVNIRKILSQIDRKTWAVLFLIFVIALALRIFIPPHAHMWFNPELRDIDSARSLLEDGKTYDLLFPLGWPFILSIVFALFGLSNMTAIYTCLALGALTVFPLFIVLFAITKRKDLALIPPLLLAIYSPHLRWSTSARANVPALFFLLCCIFFFFVYYKYRDNRSLWLVALSLAFTVQFRPEYFVLPLLFFIGCFIYIKGFFAKAMKIRFIIPFFIFILLALPSLSNVIFQELSVNRLGKDHLPQEVRSEVGLSLDNLIFNSTTFGIYVFNSSLQPIFFSFLPDQESLFLV
ncbi:hypothetical protein ACFLZ6_02545 [Nanoarchaeota archaeon]